MTAAVPAAGRPSPARPAIALRPDVLGLLLFFVMVRTSAWPLPEARWTAHLGIVGAIGAWGVLSGALAGRSRLGRALTFCIWLAYGVFLIGIYLGATLQSILTWHERSVDLLQRVGRFLGDLAAGRANADALMFVFTLSVLYWSMGFLGAWALVRRSDPWLAILPSGVALVANLAAYGGREKLDNALAVYVLLSVLLVLRLEVVRRQAVWKSLRSTASPDAAQPIALAGAVAAAVLVLLAWGGPAYARSESAARVWTRLTRPWNDMRERFDQTFRSVRNPSLPSQDLYGSSLALAAGEQPATGLVLKITPSDIPSGSRYYWRSRVYATFEEGRWSEAPGDPSSFDPDAGNLALPSYRARRTIEATVSPVAASLQTLFVPSQPLWIDRAGEATILRVSGDAADVTSFVADIDVAKGEAYRVRASIALPTGDALRRAGTAYPAWVTERYLQLPEGLTPRTLELARQITAGETRPYDQAMAITRWLRENITYQRETKAPPGDQEPLDWFLFSYRTGFCNWSATAEVILLRSLAIPARLAAGYAQGNLVPTGDTLTLREESSGYFEVDAKDAHVWPEVFFPGYGWVEFEPTPSQPELVRPETDVAPSVAIPGGEDVLDAPLRERLGETVWSPPVDLGGGVGSSLPRTILVTSVIVTAALLLLAGLFWLRADPLAWTLAVGGLTVGLRRLGLRPGPVPQAVDLSGVTPTGRIYIRWCLWLKRLGLGTLASHTPYERAAAFSDVLPALGAEGWLIARAYTAERFGGRPAELSAVRAAWSRIHRRLWQLWVTGAAKS